MNEAILAVIFIGILSAITVFTYLNLKSLSMAKKYGWDKELEKT